MSLIERLSHPEWFLPLAVVAGTMAVGLALARFVARRRRHRLLGEGARIPARHLASDLALLVALVAVAAALLGPRVGERLVEVPAAGVDVVFLFDVSASMNASDNPPSRLDRARRAAEELLARLAPFDRAALAAFAGEGVLLTPLTPDRLALVELLTGLDTDLLSARGSDLGAGLRAALDAFEEGSERPRVVVVFSDGEDAKRRRDLAAPEASRRDVRVLTVALGTDRGATVPDHGVDLVDASGSVVVSRRDVERLEVLAGATDGALFVADDWGVIDYDAALAAMRRDAGAAPGARVTRRVRAVRVAPLAALAFVLLWLEGLPRPRLRKPPPSLSALLFVAILATPAPAEPADTGPSTLEALEASLRQRPDDPHLLVELGAARLERGKRGAAARAFLAAAVHARDPQAAAVATFDLGVVALEEGDLEAARDAFYDALALDPSDDAARFNLEWTLLALEMQEPPETPPPPERRDAPPSDDVKVPPDPLVPPGDDPSGREPEPAPLSEAQQQRWLERIQDDPGTSLRAAAQAQRDPERRPGAGTPAW